MNLSKLWEMVEDRGAWHIAVHGVAKSPHYIATEQLLTGKIKNSTKNKQRPSERKKQTSTMPEKIILHRSGKFTFGQHPHSRLLLPLQSYPTLCHPIPGWYHPAKAWQNISRWLYEVGQTIQQHV